MPSQWIWLRAIVPTVDGLLQAASDAGNTHDATAGGGGMTVPRHHGTRRPEDSPSGKRRGHDDTRESRDPAGRSRDRPPTRRRGHGAGPMRRGLDAAERSVGQASKDVSEDRYPAAGGSLEFRDTKAAIEALGRPWPFYIQRRPGVEHAHER